MPTPCLLAPLPPALLSVRQIAATLGVSTATVYAVARRGELANVRIGNQLRFRPEDLEAYLAERRR